MALIIWMFEVGGVVLYLKFSTLKQFCIVSCGLEGENKPEDVISARALISVLMKDCLIKRKEWIIQTLLK